VGALALPSQFGSTGLVIGLLLLFLIGVLSWISATWVIEIEAAANAVLLLRPKKSNETSPLLEDSDSTPSGRVNSSGSVNEDGETIPNIFEIKQRVEMGLMSELFLGQIGQKLFYIILIIYLFGDLAIYAAAIPTSLSAVISEISIGSLKINNYNVYYVYLILFSTFIIPFSLFNFQKTKYLQLFTVGTRNIALISMIILGFIFIGQKDVRTNFPLIKIGGVPSFIGVSIYAFMCHHSLPSIITPIKDKGKLTQTLIIGFIFIYCTYGILCLSALWAFGTEPSGSKYAIQQLYTLNFFYEPAPIADFLALYPVFTLSTNFPLIAITLRNNVMNLITYGENSNWKRWRQIIFSLICTLPPIGIAFIVRDVDFLVSITGSYAGIFIMLILPAFLLIFSRKKIAQLTTEINPHKSPVGHIIIIYCVLLISFLFIGVVTYNHIAQLVHK